jgi:hypothetical protein
VDVLVFTSSCLESYIWPDTISQWIRQSNSFKFWENLGKSVMENQAMIRQAFGEESMSRTRVFEWHIRFRNTEKGEKGEEKVKSMLIILFYIKGIIHK